MTLCTLDPASTLAAPALFYYLPIDADLIRFWMRLSRFWRYQRQYYCLTVFFHAFVSLAFVSLSMRSAFPSKAHESTNMNLDIVVSLTTTPSRLSDVDSTLSSIFSQDFVPTCVMLHVPTDSLRSGRYYNITNLRRRLQGKAVELIVGGRDYGPITKLIGALRRIPPQANVWIITIDDDMAYPSCVLATLAHAIHTQDIREIDTRKSQWHYPAFGLSGFNVPHWGRGLQSALELPTNRTVDVLEGYAGVAYHRSAFREDFERTYWSVCSTNLSCMLSDDVAISNYLALQRVTRRALYYPGCNLWDNFVRSHMLRRSEVVLKHGTRSDALSRGGGLSQGLSERNRYPIAARLLQEHQMWGLPDFSAGAAYSPGSLQTEHAPRDARRRIVP